jgi:hypothetical protein
MKLRKQRWDGSMVSICMLLDPVRPPLPSRRRRLAPLVTSVPAYALPLSSTACGARATPPWLAASAYRASLNPAGSTPTPRTGGRTGRTPARTCLGGVDMFDAAVELALPTLAPSQLAAPVEHVDGRPTLI